MSGFEVLWQPGTDHAGIATQNVVEKHLAVRAGIAMSWAVRDLSSESGSGAKNQAARSSTSLNGSGPPATGRERFTMDEGLSKAVREVFVTLYQDGLIYRDNRLINWCPRCHTALSDLEVEHEEQQGQLWHLRYPVKDSDRFLTVATTRPETMLGDTAVAVHPEDERYADLIGKKVGVAPCRPGNPHHR
jgi:valyl-tRNA synthetase